MDLRFNVGSEEALGYRLTCVERQGDPCTAPVLDSLRRLQFTVAEEGVPAEEGFDTRHHLVQISLGERPRDTGPARQIDELGVRQMVQSRIGVLGDSLPVSRAASIPFLRGIRKSRTTTSSVSSSALQTASSPSVASPQTSQPRWLHRSRPRHCRMTGLSSAIKIRVAK